MIKSIISVCILILIIFTSFIIFNNKPKYPLDKDEQLVNKILAQSAKIIKSKYNIKPIGSGASMPGGPIRELTLCFVSKYPYTRDQLRELLIKTSAEFLSQVTENEEIQEFLKEKPFTLKNVEIIIYNHDENNCSVKDPQISVASISNSVLNYVAIDPEDTFRYKNQYKETYEDALKMINK